MTIHQVEKVYGKPSFISRTRRPELVPPSKFEPTRKQEGDIVL